MLPPRKHSLCRKEKIQSWYYHRLAEKRSNSAAFFKNKLEPWLLRGESKPIVVDRLLDCSNFGCPNNMSRNHTDGHCGCFPTLILQPRQIMFPSFVLPRGPITVVFISFAVLTCIFKNHTDDHCICHPVYLNSTSTKANY